MWRCFFAMKESHPSFSNKDALHHSSHLWALVCRCTTYTWALICLWHNWIFLQFTKWFRLSVTWCFLVTVVTQKVVIFSEWINKAAGWKQQRRHRHRGVMSMSMAEAFSAEQRTLQMQEASRWCCCFYTEIPHQWQTQNSWKQQFCSARNHL